jgi:K+/H+ antiporter YhaU regulatory subunit KhtT
VDTVRHLNVLMLILSDAALSRRVFQQFSKPAYRSVFNGLILLLLFFIYGSVFFTVAAPYFPTFASIGAFLGLAIILGLIFWQRLVRMHNSWELAFMSSMQQEAQRRITQHISTGLDNLQAAHSWKVEVEPFVIASDSRWVGKRIETIDLRNNCGAMIAGIERGGFDLTNIGPKEILFPKDHVFLLGEPEQIETAKSILDSKAASDLTKSPFHFEFDRVVIPPFSKLIGIAIKDSDLRKHYHVTIVAIQRENERIVGPHPEEVLLEDDMLLLMGSKEDLNFFIETLRANTVEIS